MAFLLTAATVLALLAAAAGLYAAYGDARAAARDALRAALERGDIGPEQYSAHIRALDEAA